MKKLIAVLLVALLVATPAFAKPKHKVTPADQHGAGERIGNEFADSVADVLTGSETKTTTTKGDLPPGLAKKGKTPPGWNKGKKTGWDKKTVAKEDSPIRKFVKSIFEKQSSSSD